MTKIDEALQSDNSSEVCYALLDLGIDCAFQHKSKQNMEAVIISPKMLRALVAAARAEVAR